MRRSYLPSLTARGSQKSCSFQRDPSAFWFVSRKRRRQVAPPTVRSVAPHEAVRSWPISWPMPGKAAP
jgi:hypothetical protein